MKKMWQNLGYVTAIGASIVLLFFVIGVTWIGYEVKDNCQAARREYGQDKDCVTALSEALKDEQQGIRVRNDAIWALGQLGDARALPVLENFYTGDIPEREPLDKVISQYELKKAINLAKGGVNVGAPFWRHGIQ